MWALLSGAALVGCNGGGSSSRSNTGGGSTNSARFAADLDRDGLPDSLEESLGSDAADPDSPYVDGQLDRDRASGPTADGVPDGLEQYLIDRGAPAPITSLTDSDGDGLPDAYEVRRGTNPRRGDRPVENGALDVDDSSGPAGDGITDGVELFLVTSGARAPVTRSTDSDADGAADFDELLLGTDPFDPGSVPDVRRDLDHDGLPDLLEFELVSSEANAEAPVANGAGDDDGDGVRNGLEDYLTGLLGLPSNAIDRSSDFDADGFPDVFEVVTLRTDPNDADQPVAGGSGDDDLDFLHNGLERWLADLRKDAQFDADRSSDFDGDGLPDALEVRIDGGDPRDSRSPTRNGGRDQDGDGVSDAVEQYLASLGGTPPILLPVDSTTDSDCDGRPDATEVRAGLDPQALNLAPYADTAAADVITFDCNGQFEDNLAIRYVAIRLLSAQFGGQDRLALHEFRARDTDGDLIPVADMSIAYATVAPVAQPAENLFDGVGLDQSRSDPTQWTVTRNKDGVGMYLALRPAPEAVVVIDLGTERDLQDVLLWNGLQRPGRTPDTVRIELLHTFEPGLGGGLGGFAPADGASELRFWVQADRGTSTTTDGALVSDWKDFSGHGRDAVASTGSGPVYRETSATCDRPHLAFDQDGMQFSRPVEDDMTVVVVASTLRNDDGNWWETPGGFLGVELPGCNGKMASGFLDGRFYWTDCGDTTDSAQFVNDGEPHLLIVQRHKASGVLALHVDGELSNLGTSTRNTLDESPVWGLGQVLNAGKLSGEMFEVATFSRFLGETELELLEQALAAKYCIPLATTLYSSGATHGDDLAGIGLWVGNEPVFSARAHDLLEVAAPSFVPKAGTMLIWGSDGADPLALSTQVPAGFHHRLARTFAYDQLRVDATGLGPLTLRFHVQGLAMGEDASRFALLHDEDGDFRDATVLGFPTYDPVDHVLEFAGLELPDFGILALGLR